MNSMVVLMYLVLLLCLNGHSCAIYCVCKDGVADSLLQTNIDYACGAGADCSDIIQNGACYQPNTVKDHCNYAVNSYYQWKGEVVGSCDFAGTAATTLTLPASVALGCVYQSTASTNSTGTGTTPSSNTGTTTPTTGTTTTGTTTPTTTPTTTTTTIPTPSVYSGLGPTGITNNNSKGLSLQGTNFLFFASLMTLWLTGLFLSH